MEKRKLGKSKLEVSAIGLGCMGMSFSSLTRGYYLSPLRGLSLQTTARRIDALAKQRG